MSLLHASFTVQYRMRVAIAYALIDREHESIPTCITRCIISCMIIQNRCKSHDHISGIITNQVQVT